MRKFTFICLVLASILRRIPRLNLSNPIFAKPIEKWFLLLSRSFLLNRFIWHQVLHNLSAAVWAGMVTASAEHSDHQTALLVVPEPDRPSLPHHLCRCISSSPGSSQWVLLCLLSTPVRSRAAPSPLLSEALPDCSRTSALASTCRATPPPQKTGPCSHTHGPVDTGSLRVQAISHSSFHPKALQKTLQIHEPAEKKGKHGKPRMRSTDKLVGSELLISSDPDGKSKTKQ